MNSAVADSVLEKSRGWAYVDGQSRVVALEGTRNLGSRGRVCAAAVDDIDLGAADVELLSHVSDGAREENLENNANL